MLDYRFVSTFNRTLKSPPAVLNFVEKKSKYLKTTHTELNASRGILNSFYGTVWGKESTQEAVLTSMKLLSEM